MRIRLNFKHVSLRKKLIVTSIACLVLPAIGMLYTTGVYSKIIIREHTLGKAEQSLMIVQSQVEAILEEMVSISNFVQLDPEIKTLLEEAKKSPVAARQLTTRLEQVAGEKQDLRLTLLTEDGRAYSDYSFYDFQPQRFFRQDWFPRAERLTPYETLFLGGLENYLPPLYPEQKYVYMTARALTETVHKAPFAYLVVSRTENSIRELFADMEEDVYLVDENNRILSNRHADWIGDRFENVLPHPISASPEIIQIGGENQLLLSLPLRFSGWKLVSVAPYEQLTGKLNGIYKTMLFLQAMFAIGFLLALTYLLRRFTKPVLALGEAAKKVESGDLSVRSNVRGPDEIGRLGRSFDFMLDRIQQILTQVKMEQELKRQAEMAMLQAQVHPHFLFNVLNSIRLKLLMRGDDENAVTVESLSSLLRASLRQDEFVTFYAEMETAKQYTDLMKFTTRFPIEIHWEIHADPFAVTVPRFILQPIIENAYKHGFSKNGGMIWIRAQTAGASLNITVEDNGLGINPDTLEELKKRLSYQKQDLIAQKNLGERISSDGIGLINVFSRLKLLYGERFEMNIQSEYGRRTTVELLLPIENAGEDDQRV